MPEVTELKFPIGELQGNTLTLTKLRSRTMEERLSKHHDEVVGVNGKVRVRLRQVEGVYTQNSQAKIVFVRVRD